MYFCSNEILFLVSIHMIIEVMPIDITGSELVMQYNRTTLL